MKESLSQELIDQLLRESATIAILADFHFTGGHLHFSNMDIPYYIEGKRYEPDELQVDSMESGSNTYVDNASISLLNSNRIISSALLSFNQLGKKVVLNVLALSKKGAVIAYADFFHGYIDDYQITDGLVTIDIVNEMILWSKKTLRRCKYSCQWGFKSTECGYSGTATSCNKTYATCSSLENEDNYGGFRFITDAEENEILWGSN